MLRGAVMPVAPMSAALGTPHFHIQDRAPVGPYGNKLDRFSLRCVFDDRGLVVMIDRYHPDYREIRPVGELSLVEASLSTILDPPPSIHPPPWGISVTDPP